MSDLVVRPLCGKDDITKFIRLTTELYQDDPHFIQPLDIERKDALNPHKNPYFDHADVALFIAERNGVPVGRISAQIDQMAQEKWGPNLGHFGYFEATDEIVAHRLLGAAEAYVKERGATRIQGPWSLSSKEECGTLVDGFNTPPAVFMPHGKPVYDGWITSYGFEKAHDLYAYELDLHKGYSDKVKRIVGAAQKNKRLVLREANMKKLDDEIAIIVDIVQDAWADNWGFVPFTAAEAKHLADNLKLVLKPHRTVICEYDGEPAGFMVTIPDINDDIRDFDGKLFPFNIFKFLGRRVLTKKEGRMRVPLMGVKQKYQKSVSGAAMALWMIDYSTNNVMKRGAFWGELGWILDINHGMNNILLDIGCEQYKTYRVYEKPVG